MPAVDWGQVALFVTALAGLIAGLAGWYNSGQKAKQDWVSQTFEQLSKENARLCTRVERLQADLDQARAELEEARTCEDDLRERVSTLEAALKAAQRREAELRDRVKALEQENRSLKAKLEAASAPDQRDQGLGQ